ncbi:hypothetical protein [Adhaeribacter aquaticus]|uniref:hypothetical protein n=1 Tax=Adhaeribacter aquaticus TaxID=299567 RepID=UPI00040B48D2|nr:hypothetical protein [Adhaeribacter aquaticus]
MALPKITYPDKTQIKPYGSNGWNAKDATEVKEKHNELVEIILEETEAGPKIKKGVLHDLIFSDDNFDKTTVEGVETVTIKESYRNGILTAAANAAKALVDAIKGNNTTDTIASLKETITTTNQALAGVLELIGPGEGDENNAVNNLREALAILQNFAEGVDVHAQLQTAASNASSALTGLVSRFEEHTVTTTGAAQALATGSQPRLITVEIDSNRDNDIVYMYTPGKPLKELFWL